MYHISHDWPIDNFFSKLINLDSELVIPEFCAPEKSSLKFRINKIASHNTCFSEKQIAFSLVYNHECPNGRFESEDSIIRYKMSFKFGKQTVTTGDCVERLVLDSGYIPLCNILNVKYIDLLDYYYRTETNKFNICCEITMLDSLTFDLTVPTPVLSELVETSKKQLLDWINSLMHDDKRNGDVTLVVPGTELKVILAQSPVLEDLISQASRIDISDLSIEIVKSLMQYLYTGKVQSLDKYANWKKLLNVASGYKLKILLQMCQHAMKQFPGIPNANGKSRHRKW